MRQRWRELGALFPMEDCFTVWKLVIASYVGFLLVWVFGFNATSSISVSAIMTLPYGTTVSNTRAYVRKRMLAQVIGVVVAYPLYLFFQWVPHLHASQRLALPMTLSLIITALINRWFHLKIADITMLIPGYLVILMTPGYALYPIMRPIYVLLGIVLGYWLNVCFFAPNYGKIIDEQLDKVGEILEGIMADYGVRPLDEQQQNKLCQASKHLKVVNDYLPRLRQDLNVCKKYRPYRDKISYIEQRVVSDEAAICVLCESLPQDEDFSQAYQEALRSLFDSHRKLLHGQTPENQSVVCPIGTSPSHAVVTARLIKYMESLFCTEVPAIPL